VLRLLWYMDNMNIILCWQLYLQDLKITHLVKNDTIVPIAIRFRPILPCEIDTIDLSRDRCHLAAILYSSKFQDPKASSQFLAGRI